MEGQCEVRCFEKCLSLDYFFRLERKNFLDDCGECSSGLSLYL